MSHGVCIQQTEQTEQTQQTQREIFVDKYVEYFLKMTHVSKISQMDCYFFQLILFIHEGSEKHNLDKIDHKIKSNCLFVNKIFDDTFLFRDHGAEYQMYTRYISEYCPDEIQLDTAVGHAQSQIFYGCNFKCPTTFELIAQKLKTCGYSKEQILQQQKDLKYVEQTGSIEEYNLKQKQFKQCIITTKNICTFIGAIKNKTC
jgi:hypothetical protein